MNFTPTHNTPSFIFTAWFDYISKSYSILPTKPNLILKTLLIKSSPSLINALSSQGSVYIDRDISKLEPGFW